MTQKIKCVVNIVKRKLKLNMIEIRKLKKFHIFLITVS